MMTFENVLNKEPLFDKIKSFLSTSNHQAYVVGGYVRDAFLQEVNKDIDIVVVSDDTSSKEKIGISFAKDLAKFLNIDSVQYFENFGTAAFKDGDVEIEIVGARKESYERGSRKPIVEDGTLDDDLSRRDFTFNAMAISLNPSSYGQLIDKFEGLLDLNAGLIKTPLDPDVTFSDDPLRMLRAIRFASRFDFKIDEATYASIKKNADRLKIISNERVVQEVNKILLSKKPSNGLKKLQDTGLLKIFLPELSNLDDKSNVEGFHHKNNFLHTVQVVDQTREVTNDIVTLWAAVLHDVGKAPSKRLGPNGWTFHDHENVSAKMANAIMLRLKMPVQEWGNKITAICKLHGRLKALTVDFDPASDVKISESAIRRLAYEAGDNLDDLLLFVKCDITTKNEAKKLEYQKNYDLLKVRILNLAEKDSLRNFKLAISGEDIMAAFNLKPSKVVGDIKDEIKNAVLDGAIANEKEAGTKLMYEIASKYNL